MSQQHRFGGAHHDKEAVIGHGAFIWNVHHAMGLKMHKLSVPGYGGYRTLDVARIYMPLHGLIDALEALAGHANFFCTRRPRDILGR